VYVCVVNGVCGVWYVRVVCVVNGVWEYVCVCMCGEWCYHLPEPDILELEVKWALKSITTDKTSGSNGIPAELFQILKYEAVKVLHSV